MKRNLRSSGGRRLTSSTWKKLSAVVYFFPAVFLLLVFFVWPAVSCIGYSFTNTALTGSAAKNPEFIGFQNYVNLFSSKDFPTVLKNTLLFLVCSGFLGQLVFGFILALLVRKKRPWIKMFVGLALSALWITPEAVAIVCFRSFFDIHGTVNSFFGLLGIEPIRWLVKQPLLTIILANGMKGCAYSFMMCQAALDNVSADVLEAAKIDGANPLQSLFRVTLPIIRGTILTNFIMVTLGTLGTCGLIMGLTGGGPGRSSTTLSMLMYKQAFNSSQLGYGMAIALIILLIGVTLSIVVTKLSAHKDK